MIIIKLNKNLDKEIYLNFIDLKFAGVNFGKKINENHLHITKENYLKYIDNYYHDNRAEIELSKQELERSVDSKQKLFFDGIKNIFGYDYSDIETVGYLSIFDCNPRWPENKTFQIFYKRDLIDRAEVVFHELSHFIFFDYFDKNLPNISPNYSKNDGPLWELSEIFNVILLNLPEFREVILREEKLFYPALTEKTKILQMEWSRKTDLKNFIERSLNILKKNN